MTAYVAGAGRWSSPRLDPGDEAVAAWAAETLAGADARADALVVATLDAGARESVSFWRSGAATGLSFANPRAFPWTLANSPTGRIALELGVRGPTFTLVGRAEALVAALDHALDELATLRSSRALVVALDAISTEETRLAALALVSTDGPDRLAAVDRDPSASGEALALETASETLAAVVERLQAGEPASIGSERDGRYVVRPRD